MRVYVAGPYTLGDVALNVKEAIYIGDQILKEGHSPFIPHLSHFWHMLHPHLYSDWMSYTQEWLKVCGAMVVIPGESRGVEAEIAFAKSRAIPIFASVEDFVRWHNRTYPRTSPRRSLEDEVDITDANRTGLRQSQGQNNAGRGSTSTDGTKRG